MQFKKIKSYAKINLALNVVGKSSKLHKIESLVAFINIYDLILIKRINKKNHTVKFRGKFSKKITTRKISYRDSQACPTTVWFGRGLNECS